MKTNFTDLLVKNINKPGRYTDGDMQGLNLQVKQNLKKYWVYRCTFEGKRIDLSFGSYPDTTLRDARKRAIEARSKINQGCDPRPIKRVSSSIITSSEQPKITFKKFSESVVEMKRAEWTNTKHADQWTYTLKQYAYPVIGDKGLDEVDTDDVLEILNPIWNTKTETASRLRGRIEWILAAATTRKLRSGVNPAQWRGHLQTILPAPGKVIKVQHHKALHYRQLPIFMAKLREMDCMAAFALEFLILNASRTGEVIGAFRSEIEGQLWKIPAERMKAKNMHEVPLCERSLQIIAIARSKDKDSKYLFSRDGKSLSSMAMAMLLRRMAIDVTVHGFRSTFRDWVSEETDHSPEVAEMALAHTIRNKVESAYRRGKLLEPRRRLLLDWQKYCEEAHSNNVPVVHHQMAA